MATEAINTLGNLNYTLLLAAVEVYRKAIEQREELETWGAYYPASACFWAGFLEGVRTQKQKQREKKAKEKPLDAANIKRQELKILANNTNSKVFNA